MNNNDIVNFIAHMQLDTDAARKQLEQLASYMQKVFGKEIKIANGLGDGKTLIVDLEKIQAAAQGAAGTTATLTDEWQQLLYAITGLGGRLSGLEDMSKLILSIRENTGNMATVIQKGGEQIISVSAQERDVIGQILEYSSRLATAYRKRAQFTENSEPYKIWDNAVSSYEGHLKEAIETGKLNNYELSNNAKSVLTATQATLQATQAEIAYNASKKEDTQTTRNLNKAEKDAVQATVNYYNAKAKLYQMQANGKYTAREIAQQRTWVGSLRESRQAAIAQYEALGGVAENSQKLNQAFHDGKLKVANYTKELKQATGFFGKLGERFTQIFKGVVMAGASWKIWAMFTAKVRESLEIIKDLDKAMVDLQMATGSSRETVQGLISDYNKMAKELGTTTTEVAKSADTWLKILGHLYSNVYEINSLNCWKPLRAL